MPDVMLSGWGRFPRLACQVSRPRDEADLRALVAQGGLIARGNGRAYGDSALSRGNTVDMGHFNRMLGFDPSSGQLVAEAGVLLGDVLRAFLPRGWFPFVTPGTKFVTLGGMIAADVHGKNHHREGGFAGFVDWVDVMGPDGETRRAMPGDPLFGWTLGGMGLTGIILRAAFRLRRIESGWIRQRTIATANLTETMAAFEDNQDARFSVAWIDCLSTGAALGRSLVTLGEHAPLADLPVEKRSAPFDTPRRRKLTMPFDAPGFLLNRHSVRAFNTAYYSRGLRAGAETLTDWDSYFYPLDAVQGWNRLYGRRGFVQFQCVLPLKTSADGMTQLMEAISATGLGSFLAVLKRLGPEGGGLSFPMEGYTLALDFPASDATMALLSRLDRITLAQGGRFYLAKDSRLGADMLRKTDPRASAFRSMREAAGLNLRFSSSQSERLCL